MGNSMPRIILSMPIERSNRLFGVTFSDGSRARRLVISISHSNSFLKISEFFRWVHSYRNGMTHRRVLDPSENVTSNTRFEHAMGIEAPIEILVEGLGKKSGRKNFGICTAICRALDAYRTYIQNRRRIRFEHMYLRLWAMHRRVDLNISWSSNYRNMFYQYVHYTIFLFFPFMFRVLLFMNITSFLYSHLVRRQSLFSRILFSTQHFTI